MTPLVWPAVQKFAHASEQKAFEVLRDALTDDDAILTNLRLTDPQYGDVEIDLVLLIKTHGCIVVETKGGHISFDGQNWIQSDRHGSRVIDPQSQAVRNMYSLRNFLRTRWSQGNLRTDWVTCFPDSTIPDVRSSALPRSSIVDKNDLPHSLSKIRSILSEQNRQSLPVFENWVELAVNAFKPLSMMEASFSAVLENNFEYIRDLTHQRELILELITDNDRILVQGPAGSGKTWLAFGQATRWTRQGLKVGVLTFNTGLASYMKNKAAELAVDKRPAFVDTFHQFAISLGTSAGSPAHYKDKMDEIEPQLLAAVAQMKEEDKFDAWIVDEAQDFLESWWKVLMLALKDPEKGKLAIFADEKQILYLNRSMPEGYFAHIRLSENIRNSQQIAEAVKPFLDRPSTPRGPMSFEVEFIECLETEVIETADDVVERLTDRENWRPGEIALLTTCHQHPVQKEQVGDRTKYWNSLWTREDVFYCTVGGFKGLERPVVVLAVDGFHDGETIEDFLYVGMTRARDKLIVVAPTEIIQRIRGAI